MERRKVLFTNGMSHDMQIIVTNAPNGEIIKWCYRYNKSQEDGKYIEPFDSLKARYYVKELYDSETDDEENVDVIGYDESYDLSCYVPENGSLEIERCVTISTIHISKSTDDWLEESKELPLIVFKKDDYGWWIWVPEEFENEEIPEDLLECLILAWKNDCHWLCLDSMGQRISSLREHIWL